MKQSVFSTEQLVDRWEWRRQIQNLMGIYSQHYLLKKEKDIFPALWSSAEDVCLAVNEGYYIGAEAVKGYYQGLAEKTARTNSLLRARFPEKVKDKTDAETFGIGEMNYFPLDTPVIEIAEDGRSAKGIWTLRNTYAQLTTGGPEARWQWGYVAVDFLREGGTFQIWHLLLAEDVNVRAGRKFYEADEPYPEVPEFTAMADWHMPEPTVKAEVWKRYDVNRKFQKPPRLPEAYDTFQNTFSYGYDGKECAG